MNHQANITYLHHYNHCNLHRVLQRPCLAIIFPLLKGNKILQAQQKCIVQEHEYNLFP